MSRQTKNSKSRLAEALKTAAEVSEAEATKTTAKLNKTQKPKTAADLKKTNKPQTSAAPSTEDKSNKPKTKPKMTDNENGNVAADNVAADNRGNNPNMEEQAPPANIPIIPGMEPAMAMLIKQMQDMQAQTTQQIAQMQRQHDLERHEAQRQREQEKNEAQRQRDQEKYEMQAKLEEARHNWERRLEAELNEKKELTKELARRDNSGPKNYGKAPKFDLEKDRDNFETWKLRWEDFLISSNINAISTPAVKEEQKKAALTAALSDDTLKWLNGQGFEPDNLKKAEFAIAKMEEHIQGTTNPYVQVVELIGRKKSANESFDHFMTDVGERGKKCALDKITNVPDWFLTMIVVANHDDVEIRKKLLLQKDLKLDTAKAICKEEEKAANTSRMLGASRNSSNDHFGASQAQQESAAAVSSYQASRGRGRGQFRGRGGHHGDRNHQHQDRGRSQSRGRPDSRQRSKS